MGRKKIYGRKKGRVLPEVMKAGVTAVVEGKKSIRAAAKEFEIPYGTLHSYILKAKEGGIDKISFEANYAVRKVFTQCEEQLIYEYLIKASEPAT